ncbi:hypothetical protein [Nocardia sp. NPDC057030]|uniref:aromatic-ring hydroxylase C-terminal domain-containing protein n=1 Tax=unclassified Nocardia TaxID=2637762 RepID=UPI00364084CC
MRWEKQIRSVAGTAQDDLGAGAVLVRPDGIVAWVGDHDPDRAEFGQTAGRWFGSPASRKRLSVSGYVAAGHFRSSARPQEGTWRLTPDRRIRAAHWRLDHRRHAAKSSTDSAVHCRALANSIYRGWMGSIRVQRFPLSPAAR